MSEPMDPQHNAVRAWLRVVGPLVLLVGIIFMIVGVGNFFASFGTFEPPRHFWCVFVGLPFLAVGGVICKFAFMGSVTRYIANEMTPVGKDVINYMADGTQDSVRKIAAAAGQGLQETPPAVPMVHCPKCHADNEASANFCQVCGSALLHVLTCGKCGEHNKPEARFCKHCGQSLTS